MCITDGSDGEGSRGSLCSLDVSEYRVELSTDGLVLATTGWSSSTTELLLFSNYNYDFYLELNSLILNTTGQHNIVTSLTLST